jgi:hypothetical protein
MSDDEEYTPTEENTDDPLGLGAEEVPEVAEETPEPKSVDKGDIEGTRFCSTRHI